MSHDIASIRTLYDGWSVTTPAPRDAWMALLAANPAAPPSQSPQWLDAVCAVGGFADASRLYEGPRGQLLLLPMARRGAAGSLAVEASLPPTWGTGGLLAPRPVEPTAVSLVVDDLRQRRVLRASVRVDFTAASLWAPAVSVADHATTLHHHVIDLDRPPDELRDRRFTTMARRSLRRAEASGLVIERDTTGRLVDTFYDVYERWVAARARRRGLPLPVARWHGRRNEPHHRLHLLAESLGAGFRVWVARLEGRAVASAISLVHGDQALYWRAASDLELAGPTRANHLLIWHILVDAADAGARWLNLGESGGVASLARFKEQFGAVAHEVPAYRFERLPLTRASTPLLEARRRAEQVWVASRSR